jgi:hypothetical protein
VTDPWTFAAIAYLTTPLLVVGLGYLAMRLHERSAEADHRRPAE